MKTKNRVLSLLLAVVMFVMALPLTALQVSADELMDYYPEVDGTGRYTEVLNSNGELRFVYAFAKKDIPCNDDFRIEWSDDFYKYYTVVKVLSGQPNPGPETSGKESGSAISEYTHEKSDNYNKSYLDIDQEDLEKYAGKYIKIAIIGYDQDGSYSCRSDTYFYISPPEKEEPDADLDIYPSEIELGESFEYEGTAYGNDYTLNTVTVGFTYYSSEYNYSKKIATDTGYLRYTGLSTDEYDVYKEIKTGSNSYLTCTDETGKTTKQFYWGYVGIYTITLYAGSNEYYEEYETNVKTTKRIDVVEPQKTQIPEADIEVYPFEIELGESFEYEGTAYGNDYTLNTVTVGFTYYSSEYNYSKKIATDTGYLRYTGLSTDEYDVYKEIKTGSNSYLTCTNETGKTTKQFYWGYVGIYTITLYAGSNEYYEEYGENVKTTVRIDVISPVSQIVGDINGDGEITNKDRFILNRYLAKMSGYTNINKTVADIDGDGDVTSDDAVILERHLFGWIGYENLDAFHNTNTVTPTDVPKWDMSFSSNAVTIELVLKEGSLDASKNYLFIAENSKGLHYTGIIEAGQTSASFSVKAMQMPRGEMYSYYIIPEGVVLAGNQDTYCIGKSVVPLFNGNMITSVKSGDRTIAKNGYVFIGDGLTINWDGSYGVDNFKLVVTLNGSEIYNKTFNHDGPGTVTISADKISAKGTGTLIISGYVEPSSASGLATAVSVWTGNVVEAEKTTDTEVDPVDLLNEDALALYMKNEDLAYLRLETYYYWQAFSDELTGGTHWGSKLEGVRADISNIVNGVFSTPSLLLDTQPKALLKQAIRTKLIEMMKADANLDENYWEGFSNLQESFLDKAMGEISNVNNVNGAIQPIMKTFALSGDAQEKIIKAIADSFDFTSFNGFKDSDALINKIVTKLGNHSVIYEGKTYKLTDFFNLNGDTALQVKVHLQNIKKAKKAGDISQAIGDAKKTYAVMADKLDKAAGVISDMLLGAELAGRLMVHADDMIALVNLHYKFEEYEDLLQDMVQSSDGIYQACIVEVMEELRNSAIKLVLAESATDLGKLVVDKVYDKLVTESFTSLHPYVKLAKISNDLITGLADTDSINKGELTLPYIVDAMNNTISKISYTYSLFMINPSNELYYELEALFVTYKFQVELGAEVYLNLSTADYNSHLKRFVRFINPFDKDDKMPETIQGCYDEDIKKLNYVLTWFGFN